MIVTLALLCFFQLWSFKSTTNSHGNTISFHSESIYAVYYLPERITSREPSSLSSADAAIANATANWTCPIRIALSFQHILTIPALVIKCQSNEKYTAIC